MRSLRLLAGAAAALILSTACGGDDGGTPPDENDPPAAAFTAPTNCVAGTACTFTDASSDDEGVTGWNWNFDADLTTAEATTATANYTFPAAGTVDVRLIVTDAEGLADTVNHSVTVAPVTPGNVNPTASFTLPADCVAGTPCGFHSTSVDPDGTIAPEGTTWDFGDNTDIGTGIDVTHTYEASGTYTVTLNVVDNAGGTAQATQQLTVQAPASTDCTTSGTLVDCALGINASSTVKITITSQDCELSGNKLTITLPGDTEQTAFFNLCNQPVGAEYTVLAPGNPRPGPHVFTAGSILPIRFHQGPQGANPPVSDPGIQVTGSYPNWTLNIDDGGAAGTPGEPDFNDVVMSVVATPQ